MRLGRHDRAGGRLPEGRLGRLRAITDTAVADPWGVAGTGAGSSALPFGYTGEQRDLATGFLHLRARAYRPSTGRFQQRDPVARAGRVPTTLNRYSYVLNNPVNRVDPGGQFLVARAIIGWVVGAAFGAFEEAVGNPRTPMPAISVPACSLAECREHSPVALA
jgi:RHS repeat-associated protein